MNIYQFWITDWGQYAYEKVAGNSSFVSGFANSRDAVEWAIREKLGSTPFELHRRDAISAANAQILPTQRTEDLKP